MRRGAHERRYERFERPIAQFGSTSATGTPSERAASDTGPAASAEESTAAGVASNERARVDESARGQPRTARGAANTIAAHRLEHEAARRDEFHLQPPLGTDEDELDAGREGSHRVRNGDHRKDVASGAAPREENLGHEDASAPKARAPSSGAKSASDATRALASAARPGTTRRSLPRSLEMFKRIPIAAELTSKDEPP